MGTNDVALQNIENELNALQAAKAAGFDVSARIADLQGQKNAIIVQEFGDNPEKERNKADKLAIEVAATEFEEQMSRKIKTKDDALAYASWYGDNYDNMTQEQKDASTEKMVEVIKVFGVDIADDKALGKVLENAKNKIDRNKVEVSEEDREFLQNASVQDLREKLRSDPEFRARFEKEFAQKAPQEPDKQLEYQNLMGDMDLSSLSGLDMGAAISATDLKPSSGQERTV